MNDLTGKIKMGFLNKYVRMGLFCFICGLTGGALKIVAEAHGFFPSLVFGLFEGTLIGLAFLSFPKFKKFFMDDIK